MAESSPVISNRRLLWVMIFVIAVVALFFLWSFRGCVPSPVGKSNGYLTIYTNLDLKDTANVVARLKDLKIPYEVKNDGSAVAVPKDKADTARLGLAEKNLPIGGSVGWEIFNETRMGATDFDRRIQLIRAISGELSRTIRRIEGVEDAHVQIVLPESKLFEVTKTPVTAAVLLKVVPGIHLRPEQVNGIVKLVSNSVEDLKPENVTIVDDAGNILTSKAYLERPTETIGNLEQTIVRTTGQTPMQENVIKKEEVPSKEIQTVVSKTTQETQPQIKHLQSTPEKPKILSEEEKALLKLKAKEEYERQLTAKVQELLNQFYPVNSIIVRVNVIFGEGKDVAKSAKLKIKSDAGFIVAPIQKITVIGLVDNRLKLTGKLKESTYQTIAIAVPYNKSRGDKIILKQVPFHYAEVLPKKAKDNGYGFFNFSSWIIWGAGIVLSLVFVLAVARVIRPRQKKQPFGDNGNLGFAKAPSENEAMETVKSIKNMAKDNPERIASLLKHWLTEE